MSETFIHSTVMPGTLPTNPGSPDWQNPNHHNDSTSEASTPLVYETGGDSKGHQIEVKIDKLSITMKPIAGEGDVIESEWINFLVTNAIALEEGKMEMPQEAFPYGVTPGARGNYRAAIRIHTPVGAGFSSETFVLVQVGPRAKDASHYVRLEWNPAKASIDTLKRVAYVCTVGLGFDFATFFPKAIVTRLDLATDLHGVQIENFAWENRRKRCTALYLKAGVLQTHYMGRKRQNCLVVYDKAAEAGLLGALTRVEARLRPNKKIAEFVGVTNPFTHLQVHNVLAANLPQMSKANKMALHDSIQQKGMARALIHHSSALRPIFRAAINEVSPQWWQPDSIWHQAQQRIAEILMP